MITVTEYAGQKVGVFGLGKAGQAAVASLSAGGAQVFSWDDKGNGSMAFEQWPWAELKALVLSPGVPLTHPKPHPVVELAHAHNVPVIGEVELLYRACPDARFIGITGTNGKSTTTTLIGHILQHAGVKAEVGGNLGTPALALAPLGKDGIYVLELSSYQLDLLKTVRFNIAAFLNVTPDHLDRHGDMEGYIAAKMHIFDRQQKGDVAVIAVDDEYTKGIRDSGFRIQEIIEVSAYQTLVAGVYVQDGVLIDARIPNPESRIRLNDIATLTGQHNWQNAVVAYGVARACGVAPDVIYKAMQSFEGLRHRLQTVAIIKGVRFINDSKATNADATSHALAPFENIYWILGGKPKEGGIVPLAEYFPKVAHAFLIGQAEDEFAQTLEGKVAYTRCGTLDVAVKKAADMAFKDSGSKISSPNPESRILNPPVVLLSPACASFDQFKSFEERGDVFCTLVEELAHAS